MELDHSVEAYLKRHPGLSINDNYNHLCSKYNPDIISRLELLNIELNYIINELKHSQNTTHNNDTDQSK